MLTLPESTGQSTGALSIRARAFVFEDPQSRALLSRIERIGRSHAPVLITGETGTGKELVARALHAASERASQPFVAVNAGAFSEQLIEAELFGHEKGAFTGAHTAQAGWFETAHGGTLFLDEIGDLPLALQVKLLRVLQEGEVTRLGSRQPTAVNVRLIAATNVDLSAAMRNKRFREDLYYRLKVASLNVPPLRERSGDILPLARHFLLANTSQPKQRPVSLSLSAEQALLRYNWPGNIRELENALHHALLVHQGDHITREDLPFGEAQASALVSIAQPLNLGIDEAHAELAELERVLTALLDRKLPDLHERVEAALLSTTYQYTGRNQLETARLLGMSRNVVRARLIEYGELTGPLRRSTSLSIPPHLQLARPQPTAAGRVELVPARCCASAFRSLAC
jgi:sigma-54-specific transcriptional regulator